MKIELRRLNFEVKFSDLSRGDWFFLPKSQQWCQKAGFVVEGWEVDAIDIYGNFIDVTRCQPPETILVEAVERVIE